MMITSYQCQLARANFIAFVYLIADLVGSSGNSPVTDYIKAFRLRILSKSGTKTLP